MATKAKAPAGVVKPVSTLGKPVAKTVAKPAQPVPGVSPLAGGAARRANTAAPVSVGGTVPKPSPIAGGAKPVASFGATAPGGNAILGNRKVKQKVKRRV